MDDKKIELPEIGKYLNDMNKSIFVVIRIRCGAKHPILGRRSTALAPGHWEQGV